MHLQITLQFEKKKLVFFFYYLEHYMLTGKVLCLSQETSVKTEMASYNIRRLLIGPNQRFFSPSMCDPIGSALGCLTQTRWLHWKKTPKNVLQYIYIPVSLHADIVKLYLLTNTVLKNNVNWYVYFKMRCSGINDGI